MHSDYLPSQEAQLLAWSLNFDAIISVDFASLGLDAAQAGDYQTVHRNFSNAYAAAVDPGTNSSANITIKNDAKTALIAKARELAGIIQQFPGTTNGQRTQLGLTVRDTEPTPVAVPTTAPIIDVINRFGHTVRVKLHDPATPDSRARPEGVAGANIFSFVGDTPPVELADWVFHGNVTRTTINVEFPASVAPGSKVWITAFWYNTRGDSGPVANSKETWLDSQIIAKKVA